MIDARYRTVSVRLALDTKWRDQLSDDGRLMFYNLLTHRHTNRLGVYVGNAATLAAEWPGRWQIERMSAALDEMVRADMLRLDAAARVVWLRNFLRYHEPPNPNVVRSWRHDVAEIPECDLRSHVLSAAWQCVSSLGAASMAAFRAAVPEWPETPTPEPLGTPLPKPSAEPFDVGMAKQDQDQDQDQELKDTDTDRVRVRGPLPKPLGKPLPNTAAAADAEAEANTAQNDEQTKPTNDERTNGTNTLPPTPPRDGNAFGGAWPGRRRRLNMAWESERACMSVPHHLHEELLSRMATPDEAALRAWYAEIGKRYATADVGDDVHELYRREFKEWKGTSEVHETAQQRGERIAARMNARRALRGVR